MSALFNYRLRCNKSVNIKPSFHRPLLTSCKVRNPLARLRWLLKPLSPFARLGVLTFMDECHERLVKKNRFGTVSTVQSILKAMARYKIAQAWLAENLLFTDLTPSYIDDFRSSMAERSSRDTSVSSTFLPKHLYKPKRRNEVCNQLSRREIQNGVQQIQTA